jgi:hypothetical protein
VSRPGQEGEAQRALAPFGALRAAEPSLEDVFVSLARVRNAAAKQMVTA